MVNPTVLYHRMLRQTRGADWRTRLALEYSGSEKTRVPCEFDAATRKAAAYYRLGAQGERGKTKAQQEYPDIALAQAVWDQPNLRATVQTLILANVANAEICEMLNLQPSSLQTIEDLYFDVRPMLSAASWIVARVIAPEGDAGRDDLAARMRIAYFSGPYVAKTLIAAGLRLPTERVQQLADASILLYAKFAQAMEMPLNPEQLLDFIKLNVEIRRDEQLLQLERQKLAFRMQRWAQRCELFQARRPAAQEVFNGDTAAANPQVSPTTTAHAPIELRDHRMEEKHH